MLCERCRAELAGTGEPLPNWLDEGTRSILINGDAWRGLSKTEWRLVEILWQRRRTYVSRESLMALLYAHRVDPPYDQVIDTMMCYLRKKLIGSPIGIKTIWADGWRMIEQPAVVAAITPPLIT